MYKDVVIGTGNRGNSATTCWQPKTKIENKCSIFQNSNVFWIHMPDVFGGNSLFIFKDTVPGRRISDMLQSKAADKRINDFVLKTYLNKMKPSDILMMINRANQRGFETGREAKAQEIIKALGL